LRQHWLILSRWSGNTLEETYFYFGTKKWDSFTHLVVTIVELFLGFGEHAKYIDAILTFVGVVFHRF
jgi:hypothetical protein